MLDAPALVRKYELFILPATWVGVEGCVCGDGGISACNGTGSAVGLDDVAGHVCLDLDRKRFVVRICRATVFIDAQDKRQSVTNQCDLEVR